MYHIGFSKRGKTMVIEARRCIDFLSCELYDYMGQREITKKQLRANRYQVLDLMKQRRPDVYGRLKFAVVD